MLLSLAQHLPATVAPMSNAKPPRAPKKLHPVNIRMDEAMLNRLRSIADEEDRTVSIWWAALSRNGLRRMTPKGDQQRPSSPVTRHECGKSRRRPSAELKCYPATHATDGLHSRLALGFPLGGGSVAGFRAGGGLSSNSARRMMSPGASPPTNSIPASMNARASAIRVARFMPRTRCLKRPFS